MVSARRPTVAAVYTSRRCMDAEGVERTAGPVAWSVRLVLMMRAIRHSRPCAAEGLGELGLLKCPAKIRYIEGSEILWSYCTFSVGEQ
jgi:hypothetical protein